MAEISRLHTLSSVAPTAAEEEEEEEEVPDLYIFDYGYLSPPDPTSYNPSFNDFNFAPYSLSESESEKSDSDRSEGILNPFFYSNEEEMNFVADLFQYPDDSVSDDVHRVFGDSFNGANLSDELELGLGLGFGRGFDAVFLPSESRGFRSSIGLRVAGIESESDSEDAEIHSAISDLNGALSSPRLRDCYRFNDQGAFNEEFDWEEVNERVDERDNLSSLIDRIEEISVSSGITSSEGENPISDDGEEVLSLGWEMLLAMNYLERPRNLEFNNDVLGDDLNVNDEFVYATAYDPMFGFSDGALNGSPPAAKYIVDNLPLMVLTDEKEDNVCAVCKDDVLVGEKVNRLPCSHLYHGDCIVPWLNIRNTCPVCRYELPTNDANYEKKKNQRHTNPLNDFEVRYNFEVLP